MFKTFSIYQIVICIWIHIYQVIKSASTSTKLFFNKLFAGFEQTFKKVFSNLVYVKLLLNFETYYYLIGIFCYWRHLDHLIFAFAS